MDVVVSATPKLDVPPIRAEWWASGSVMVPLDVTGAWDDATFLAADCIACDGPANLQRAFERYRPGLALDPGRLVSLQALAAGTATGRKHSADRILAFVTGIASVDMTLAWAIYRRALAAGCGRRFEITA
jgi:ornithine cyclodeaminase/alanine dehydrogenase-like protein (mu-crystallin family)